MRSSSVFRVLCVSSALSASGVSFCFADTHGDTSKWYLGVGGGISSMSPEPRDSEYQDILADDDIGIKLFGGYNINPNWVVEGYYSRLGESEVDATRTINSLPTPQAIAAYNNWQYAKKGKIGYQAFGVSGLWFPGQNNGHLTGGRFNYFLGAGLNFLHNEPLSNEQNKKIKYKQDNAFSLMLTGGLEYELSKHFTARLSADSYDKDTNLVMLGLMYGISSDGKTKSPEPTVVTVAEPEPVIKPIEVPPEPVVELKPVEVVKSQPVIDYASQVKSAVIAWAESWQAQDVDGYLGSYVPNFKPENKSHTAWEKLRIARVTDPSRINLNLSDIQVTMLNNKNAVATFTQAYRSNLYKDTVLKELRMKENNGVWFITSEKVLQKIK